MIAKKVYKSIVFGFFFFTLLYNDYNLDHGSDEIEASSISICDEYIHKTCIPLIIAVRERALAGMNFNRILLHNSLNKCNTFCLI